MGDVGRFRRPLTAVLLGASLAVGSAAAATADPVGPFCVVDTEGLLGWWRGEDDLLAEVGPDLSGAVGFADGLVGRAMSFDDASSASTTALAAPSTALTFETWVRPVANGRFQAIASRWAFPSTDDSARAYALYLGPAGRLTWQTDETSTRRPEELTVSAPQLVDGQLHHVAGTWDQARMVLYIDGVEAGAKASQRGTLNPAPSVPFRLGAKSGLGDPFALTGLLDEPSVWGRALSAAEVFAIYDAGPAGKCSLVPVQQGKLTKGAGPGENDWFGYDVAIDAATIVAGVPYDSPFGLFEGSAHVFTRSGTTWSPQAVLTASDAWLLDLFGWSVAIDGDTAVVGAYGANAGATDTGAAYVFTRSGSTWTQQAKLVATDADAGDGLGYAVAIDGDTVAVGAPLDDQAGSDAGAVYVFTRSGTTWTQQAKLSAANASALDNFGLSVDVDADTVVAGAFTDGAGSASGSAYVFTRSGTTWTQQAELTASDAASLDVFGSSVAVDGDTAAIGAPYADQAGVDSGTAYVFTRSGTTWTQQAELTGSTTSAGDEFGASIGLDGQALGVGADHDDVVAADAGSATVFAGAGATWSELTTLSAFDGEASDRFGFSIGVAGTGVVVGAYLNGIGNPGAAYPFG